MKYDIFVTAFHSKGAKTLLARQIARDPSIALHDALSKVEHLPFILVHNAEKRELKTYAEQLSKLGVSFKVAESPEAPPEKAPSIIPHTKSVDSAVNIPVSGPPVPCQKEAVPLASDSTPSQPRRPVRITPISNETPRRKGNHLLSSVLTIVVISIIMGGLFFNRSTNRYLVKKTGTAIVKMKSSPEPAKNSQIRAVGKKSIVSGQARNEISPQQKALAEANIDSARVYGADYQKAINFYKIAISFNRYNLHAWYGLINAYRNAGMSNDMRKAQSEMQELFGESVFSVSKIIEPFGLLRDVFLNNEDAYRIEYQSFKKSEQDLLSETYKIIRALQAGEFPPSISLFATTGPGSGMMVHIRGSEPIATMDSFKKNASITFLQP